MLRDLLKRLMLRTDLTESEMAAAIGEVIDGGATSAQVGAFLVALRLKGETVEELSGAARAMRERMTPVRTTRTPLIDTCGTGGDAAGTFNISTAVAFVAAAGGAAVAKHGNRAVSSRCGSADVLGVLGVNLDASPETVGRCVDEIGVGFLFAPALHPAMGKASDVRRELGVRTIFNVLGPLTNPAGARRQLLGVFNAGLTAPIAEVLARLGCDHAWVVHGEDGLDELSVCAPTTVAEAHGGRVTTRTVTPEEVGLRRSTPEGLRGGTAEENAGIMREILAGVRPGPMEDAVALNAGAALLVAGLAGDLASGVARARALLRAGAPLQTLEALVQRSHAGEALRSPTAR